jgi:protocatechuate 3,4-dioxygenase, alpha subunit
MKIENNAKPKTQNPKLLRTTPSQTIGPFFAYSLTAEQYGYDFNSLINSNLSISDVGCRISEDAAEIRNPTSEIETGERIFITGRILDGGGNTVNDAMIELWQADPKGQYRLSPINHKNDGFTGFGRLGTGTNAEHRFTFETLKPAPPKIRNPKIRNPNTEGAPHINVILFMRGSLHHLYTRLYFSDEIEANQNDPLLNAVAVDRRNTLIAERKQVNDRVFYTFDIRIQGEGETVFFEV